VRKARLLAEPEIPENLLANASRRPGSVPPASDWLADVRKLLDELDLVDVLHEVDGMAEGIAVGNIAGAIGRIDALVRTALQQRQEGRGGLVGMAAGGRRRRVAQRDKTSEARAKFAYDLCRDTTIKYSLGLRKFQERADKEHWESIETPNGLRHIASDYAKRHHLDPLPKRQGK
jgi:hypothetical protein